MIKRVNITKRIVEALPFSDGPQVIHWDKALPGFGIRVGANRKTYLVQKKINGRDVKITLGPHGHITAEQAREMALQTLSDITKGINPNQRKREDKVRGVTLKTAFEDYKKDRGALKSLTLRDYENIMSGFFHDWKNKPITEITRDMVLHRHKEIGEGKGGKARANLSMRFLRALINYAMGKYTDGKGKPIIMDNSVKALSHARAWYRVERRQTLIKAHELPRLFDAMDKLNQTVIKPPMWDTTRDYILFILFTGMRRNEAATLKWVDVDFNDKTFVAPDTKNRKPLALPMSNFIHNLLKARHEKRSGDYVFPASNGISPLIDIHGQHENIKKESGLAFSLHDLRRTFITIADGLDISAYAIKRLVNHTISGGDVTGGYIIADAERLRAPMQAISDKILVSAGRKGQADVIPFTRRKDAS